MQMGIISSVVTRDTNNFYQNRDKPQPEVNGVPLLPTRCCAITHYRAFICHHKIPPLLTAVVGNRLPDQVGHQFNQYISSYVSWFQLEQS